MSTRDDLTRAGEEARAQVRAARDALAASRAASTGGEAKDARQAEQQLHALREAVAGDLRTLRGRLVGLDPVARRTVTTAAVAGAGMVALVVGSGLAVRGSIRRAVAQRSVQQQALAIATAIARQAGGPSDVAGARRAGRGGRGALLAALTLGTAVAGALVEQRRRSAPVDDADLWLPERDLG